MDFYGLMCDHISRFDNYDLYQDLFNTLDEFCKEHGYQKPSAEMVLTIYGALLINRRIKDAE